MLRNKVGVACQKLAIDRDSRERGHDTLRRRSHLVRPVTVVAVEVLLYNQLALSVYEYRVNVLVRPVDYAMYEARNVRRIESGISEIASAKSVTCFIRNTIAIRRRATRNGAGDFPDRRIQQ